MNILLEGRSLINKAGTGVYFNELLINLLKIDKENHYFAIVPVESTFEHNADNLRIIRLETKGHLNRLKGDFLVPKIVEKYKIDLIHYTKGTGPEIKNKKTVITVHDTIPLTNNFRSDLIKRLYWRINLPRMIRISSRIIAVSNYSRQTIEGLFPESIKKIVVIYNGYVNRSIKKFDAEPLLRNNGLVPNDVYIFFAGRVQERKNIRRIVEAYERVALHHKKLKLVIGGEVPREGEFVYALRNKSTFKDKIIITGYLEERELGALFCNAFVFCFASSSEGFGIPILEAQSQGCPVITSNLTSMPEIAGKGALLVDPYSVKSISDAIFQLLNDSKKRENLINEGYENVKRFSFERCAEKTLKVYEEVFNEHTI